VFLIYDLCIQIILQDPILDHRIVTTTSSNTNNSNTSLSDIAATNLTAATHNDTALETSSYDGALSIVSYIGCGISIICLLATIIIILLFRYS